VPQSIKGRLALLAVGLILLLSIGGWYTQHTLTALVKQNTELLAEQNLMRRHIEALNQALQQLEFHLYQASLDLQTDFSNLILEELDQVERLGRQLIEQAGGADEQQNYASATHQLPSLLSTLRQLIEQQLKPLTDSRQRYPAMPYLIDQLAPTNIAFLSTIRLALQEGRDLRADEGGPTVDEILDTLHELRFAWSQRVQMLRMFIANRSGTFGQPEQAMRSAARDNALYSERIDELLARLQLHDEVGDLGFQQSVSLAQMRQIQRSYSDTMASVVEIYQSDRWRSDLTTLRYEIQPLFLKLWSIVSALQHGLDNQNSDALRQAEASTRTLSHLIGLFSLFIALLLLTTFTTFEYGLRRPLVRVASAMEEAARGDLDHRLIPPSTTEMAQLVETFHAMQQQIRRRQLDLVESEKRFRTMVDNATDAMLVFDSDGQVVDANRNAELSLGFSREALLQCNMAEITNSCSNGSLNEIIQQVQREGVATCTGTCRRHDGSTYPAEARIGEYEWQGQPLLIALVRDVQDRQRLERQLRQSEKLASIGQLAAGVAHEINNPVGFVHSNLLNLRDYMVVLTDLLDRYQQLRQLLPADQPECLALAQHEQEAEIAYLRSDLPSLIEESLEGTERVRRIVRDLMDFSHSDQARWQLTELKQCIEAALNIAGNEIKHKAEVIREYQPTPQIECMPGEIGQVLVNLLVNAAQSISDQGTIRITTSVCPSGKGVAAEIIDNGRGIEPELLPRLFEPFFTTKPIGQGTGLGLSVSYGIIERHHGTIEVESQLGVGTTFRIWLPLRQSSLPASVNQPSSGEIAIGHVANRN